MLSRDNTKHYTNLILQYALNLTAILIAWGGMLRTSFNADSLSHMFSADADVMVNVEDGRYVIAFFDWLLLRCGIRTTDYIPVFMLLTLMLLALALVYVQKVFAPFIVEGTDGINLKMLCVYFSSWLFFLNVLFSEPLGFTEMSVYFGVAYFCASYGAYAYSKKHYIQALILLFLGACTYQYSCVYTAFIVVFFVLIEAEAKCSISLFLKEALAICSTFGMGLANLICIKLSTVLGIIGSYRKTISSVTVFDRIPLAISALGNIYKSAYGLMFNLFIPCFITIVLFVIVIYIGVKLKDVQFVTLSVVAYIGCTILMVVIPLMSEPFYIPGRMGFVVFELQGLLALLILWKTKKCGCNKNPIKITSVVIACYLAINCIIISFIISDKYVSNHMDVSTAKQVISYIEKYERESGEVIDTIAIGYDEYAPDSYDEVDFHAMQINERTLCIAPISLLKFVSGRDFNKLEMSNEDRLAMFGDVDWSEIDVTEQMRFDNNIAYWCIY